MKKISLEKYFVSFSKDTIVYGLGNAVLAVLMVLTTPILTRIFTPADYGVINYIVSIISFISLILIFGMDSATHLSYFQYKDERKVIVSSTFWFLFFWGGIILGLCSFFASQISRLFFHSDSYQIYLLITFWSAFLALLLNFIKTVFRLEFRAKIFATISIINAILITGLIIYFTAFLHLGIKGYFLASFLGNLLSFLIALVIFWKNLLFKVSWFRLKEMIIFGSLLFPSFIFYYTFDLIDRFFVQRYWNFTELGLYAMAANLTSVIIFFITAFGQAWSPIILKMYFEQKNVYRQFVPRIFIYILVFFVGSALFISFFGPELLRIFTTPRFYGASRALIPLTLTVVFMASIQVSGLGMNVTRNSKFITFHSFFAAILNIILNFLLIPKYGMVGAAWATAITYLFLTTSFFWRSQRLAYLKIDWLKVGKLSLLTAGCFIIFPLTWRFGFWINFVVKLLEFAIYPVMIYFLGIIEKVEITNLKNLILKIKVGLKQRKAAK